jgi:hypothetical protein
MRYWTAECTYDGKRPFWFYSGSFESVAETETAASDQLQAQVSRAWAEICPHPAPRLLSVIPGRMVLEREADCLRMDGKRVGG